MLPHDANVAVGAAMTHRAHGDGLIRQRPW